MSGLCVKDCMSRAPAQVTEDASIGTALARMQSADVRHLLVMDGDRLCGVVSVRDLRRLAGSALASLLVEPVSRIMTDDPVTVAPDTPVATAARVLLDRKIGALPVRDGDDIIGIFTTADALEALLAMAGTPAR
jgi:CBS domain-containing protein